MVTLHVKGQTIARKRSAQGHKVYFESTRSALLPEHQHGTGTERCQYGTCGAAICCSRHIGASLGAGEQEQRSKYKDP